MMNNYDFKILLIIFNNYLNINNYLKIYLNIFLLNNKYKYFDFFCYFYFFFYGQMVDNYNCKIKF